MRNQPTKFIAGLLLYLLIESWLYPAFSLSPVTINDRVIMSKVPARAFEVLKDAGYDPSPGRFLDVDGRAIRPAGGFPAYLTVNGRPATPEVQVKENDRLIFTPAMDKKEPVTTAVEDIFPKVKVSGSGKYTLVKSLGRTGKKMVAKGAASGKIVAARNLEEARPMEVALTDARPQKVLALTFDDGPNPPFTSRIVRLLKDMRVSATFFVVGSQAAKHPESVQEIQAAGFQIANHSYSHHRLDKALEPLVVQELDAVRNLVFPVTNSEPRWFRPPYGATSPMLDDILNRKGYRLVKWNVDSEDWKAINPDELAARVVSSAFPGAIVLLHDGGGDRTNTVLALPKIIRALYAQGYAFVTLDQLVEG